jgi:hypothetical protein
VAIVEVLYIAIVGGLGGVGLIGVGLVNIVIEVVNIVKVVTVVKDISITLIFHKGCVQSVHPFYLGPTNKFSLSCVFLWVVIGDPIFFAYFILLGLNKVEYQKSHS